MASLEKRDLADAEAALKAGADPLRETRGKSLMYDCGYAGDEQGAALLGRYGAKKSDFSRGAAERRAEDQKQAALAVVQRQRQDKALRWLAGIIAEGSSSGSTVSDASESGTAVRSATFTSSGYNDMKVTYDRLRNTAPTRGTNTIHVSLGDTSYSITYDFYPGSYMCHGGDLTGATVNVKFSGGRPISVKNYPGGVGYVDVSSYERL